MEIYKNDTYGIIHWIGPGWYASRQEGQYENVRIETFWCGDEEERPDTSKDGLGTPKYLISLPQPSMRF